MILIPYGGFSYTKANTDYQSWVQSVQGATALGKDRKYTLSSMQFRGCWREFPAKRKTLPQKVVSDFSRRFCSLNSRWKADGWSGWFTLTPPEPTGQSFFFFFFWSVFRSLNIAKQMWWVYAQHDIEPETSKAYRPKLCNIVVIYKALYGHLQITSSYLKRSIAECTYKTALIYTLTSLKKLLLNNMSAVYRKHQEEGNKQNNITKKQSSKARIWDSYRTNAPISPAIQWNWAKKEILLNKLGTIDLTAKCNFVWVQIPMHQLYFSIFEICWTFLRSP